MSMNATDAGRNLSHSRLKLGQLHCAEVTTRVVMINAVVCRGRSVHVSPYRQGTSSVLFLLGRLQVAVLTAIQGSRLTLARRWEFSLREVVPMRLATYNVENLFSRPAAMNLDNWAAGRPVLDDIGKLEGLLAQDDYTPAIKASIAEILDKHGFGNRNKPNPYFTIREVRGKLYKIPKGTSKPEVVANGRREWVGWIELLKTDLPGDQVINTGRVIDAVSADVLCLVEVEDRLSLDRFNREVLGKKFRKVYTCDMLIDGNDPRGIDIGLLTRYSITAIRSHLHDGGKSRVFSRDCPEFEVEFKEGTSLWVLGNHFKSKGYGNPLENDARRLRQAEAVAAIYLKARRRSDLVAVVGDLNDFPASDTLAPLIQKTDLLDVMTHQSYVGDPGTYMTGKQEAQKIDYVLLSPALWDRVQQVGVERRGIWAPRTFKSFPEVTGKADSGSDHASLWVDLDL